MKLLHIAHLSRFRHYSHMAFALYAIVAEPAYSTRNGDSPDRIHPAHCSPCHRIRIDDYATRRRAERAAERLTFVWIDADHMVPLAQVKMLEIVEEP